ncbi:CaiB/BaiF CoA transferase family protein [Chloroflexota bacterium]
MIQPESREVLAGSSSGKEAEMVMPLEGIKVLDVTEAWVGPYATVLLSDMGADVIKIERHAGDRTRMRSISIDKKGIPTVFLAMNHNKKSITVDLKKEKGREIALQLAERSDVFVENMRLGAIDRLGLSYDEVSKRNPKIIYASASSWGPRGPDATKPAVDILGQARGGIMSSTGPPGQPTPVGEGIADHMAGLYLSYAILVALLHRERTGVGQRVYGSMLGAQVALQCRTMTGYLINEELVSKSARGHTMMGALWTTFKTKDIWIALGGMAEQRWPRFCQVMGIEHLIDDPRFATPQARLDNGEQLVEILDEIFPKKSGEEWIKELEEKDIFVAPVNTLAEVAKDPQVIANEYVTEVDYPGHGKVKLAGIPIHFTKTPVKIRKASPELGEHTHEILLDLGYTWEEIGQLVSEEVV